MNNLKPIDRMKLVKLLSEMNRRHETRISLDLTDTAEGVSPLKETNMYVENGTVHVVETVHKRRLDCGHMGGIEDIVFCCDSCSRLICPECVSRCRDCGLRFCKYCLQAYEGTMLCEICLKKRRRSKSARAVGRGVKNFFTREG